MFSEEVFERERRAYELICQSIKEMLASGYEVRMFDNVPHAELEMLFVGPPQIGERPHIQKLVLPYQFVSLLADGDPVLGAELNWHVRQVQESSRRMHAFLHELLLRKFDGGKGDNRDH